MLRKETAMLNLNSAAQYRQQPPQGLLVVIIWVTVCVTMTLLLGQYGNVDAKSVENTPSYASSMRPAFVATPNHTHIAYTGSSVYLSSSTGGTIGTVSFADEDIVAYDISSGTWSMIFDGSDVGISGEDIDAFDIVDSDTVLISLNSADNLTDVGAVDDSDVLSFTGSFGDTTSGTWGMFFDGSDVGLTASNEDVDAISLKDSQSLLLSVSGIASVSGLSGIRDEDILLFTATSLGDSTAGSWAYHFNGSNVDLNGDTDEDTRGFEYYADHVNEYLYITTRDAYSITTYDSTSPTIVTNELSGNMTDIFYCVNELGTFGEQSDCDYLENYGDDDSHRNSNSLVFNWNDSGHGFDTERIDALAISDVDLNMTDEVPLLQSTPPDLSAMDLLEDEDDNEPESMHFMPIIQR
ncbi:MAG: hypothetical protein AAF639_24245 [Chloroflexota bacterium]